MVDSVVSFMLNVAGTKVREIITRWLRSRGAFAQSLSDLLETDLSTMKRQLEALTKKELRESINLLGQGLSLIPKANDIEPSAGPSTPKRRRIPDDHPDGVLNPSIVKTSFIDEAKERFKDARKKAGSAIANEAMKTIDAILAISIMVLSQMLETDDLAMAYQLCLVYLEQLHSHKDVKKSFEDEFRYIEARGKVQFWPVFGSIDARKILWCVCSLNRFVFDMAKETGEAERSPELFKAWPCVKPTNHQIEIDPLRDPRLVAIFKLENRPFSIAPSLFDQNDAEESRPQSPSGRAETTTCAEYNNEEASPSPSSHQTPERQAKNVTLVSSQTTSKANRELQYPPQVGTKRKREEEEGESN